MKKLNNIASIEGRILLQEIYHKLKFERQRNSFSVLLNLWQICTVETEINQYINKEEVTILHKLGLLRGTILWLEEVVNRYYFSTINSFVYFGAAVLLVLIGLNNFTDVVDNSLVIYGLIFEASMLLFMFLVMLFTPNDDIFLLKEQTKENDLQKELLDEVGEISRDFALTSAQLEKIATSFETIIEQQNSLVEIITDISKTNIEAVHPNTQMLEIMKATNYSIADFNKNIQNINTSLEQIKSYEIEKVVKKEIELFFRKRLDSDNQ